MKFWRFIWIMASFLLLLVWTGTGAVQAAGAVKITVDGNAVETDVAPFIDENARTMVPVRFVSEALGCHVGWNPDEQRVRVSRTGTIVELYINNKIAKLNGEDQELDTAAVLKDGRTMVPLRFLAETFGLEVGWKGEERLVAITSPPPPRDPAAEQRIATVNGSTVNIRTGPGTDYDRVTQVDRGTSVKILGEDSDWFQVELPAGDSGWIAGWLVDFGETSPGDSGLRGVYSMPEGAARTALVMKPSVNVRSAPGVQFPVVSRVTLGQQLTVTGEQNNWYGVRLPDGSSGWIAGWLVAVRYDSDGHDPFSDGSLTAGLISRWNIGEQSLPDGELPLLTGLEVKKTDQEVLLKISSHAPLELPSSFRLDNPSRLVFDLTAKLGEDGPDPDLQINHGPVTRFRLGQFEESAVRIVADLQGPASYALDRSADGRTITIRIRTVDPADRVIVIDPGHGGINNWGSDPGAIGPSGLTEREVNQRISQMLGNILLNEGFTVLYTNESDTGLSLDERAMVGSISGAELLVSIHSNASTNRATAGTMTFYHDAASSGRVGLARDSRALAGFIQAELVRRLQREDKGVRHANFIVLRTCPIPAALVEVAFISNPEEERLLADSAFQRKAAEAVALGIKRYLAAR